MTKRTLYLEDETAEALRQLASSEGCSEADVIREALVLYKAKTEPRSHAEQPRPLPKGIGEYRSGRSDVSERAEDLLREAARRRQ